MKTVLISGCGSGFGALSALEFARAGYRVIATMRDPSSADPAVLKAFDVEPIHICALDVTDRKAIADCVSSVTVDHGKIDVLVNNAGLHLLGAIEDMEEFDIQRVMQTNFFGALNFSRAVIPTMRAAGSGHIITVSSVGSRIGRVADGIYCASKAAIETALEAMRYEVAPFGIDVTVLCPGAFRTGIDRNFKLSKAQERSPYSALLLYRAGRVRDACMNGGAPEEVARALRQIVEQKSPVFRNLVGTKALELDQAFSAADARQRERLLTNISGIDWWLAGAGGPEEC